MDEDYDRAFCIWHRRSGKDKSLWNMMIKKTLQRVGSYFYVFPFQTQARKVIWEGMDNQGFRFIDHIPRGVIEKKLDKEMKLFLSNGSTIQVVGSDNPDSLRGTNAIGWVFSEYAWQNPIVWDAIASPILNANGGWAVFNTTPQGKNHCYDLFKYAEGSDRWFTQILTYKDTLDEAGSPIISEEDLEEERKRGMNEELIKQEYECSFNANNAGYYYMAYIDKAKTEGRIGQVPYDARYPVDTWWDIGVGDSTAIWFTQSAGKAFHVIDFYQANSYGLEHYANVIRDRGYVIQSVNFPWDVKKSEFGSGRTSFEMAEELFRGIEINVVPKLSIEDGIQAVRSVLPRCYFDEERCREGLNGLMNYRRKYDEKNQEFLNNPIHNFASHPSDGFRYFAVGVSDLPEEKKEHDPLARIKKLRKQRRNWMAA